MTQVITVSPATAAYASEAYKPRNPKHSPMESAISEWHARAVESANAFDRGLLNVVRPPSLQLAFLTAHPAQPSAVSVEQAIAEYASNDGKRPESAEAPAPTPQETAPAEPSASAAAEPATMSVSMPAGAGE